MARSRSIINIICLILFLSTGYGVQAQELDMATLAKRAGRKNLVIKEWNTDSKSKTRWLDRVTTYDDQGRKIEQIEYASYGQKWRETYEYGEQGEIMHEIIEKRREREKYIRMIMKGNLIAKEQ